MEAVQTQLRVASLYPILSPPVSGGVQPFGQGMPMLLGRVSRRADAYDSMNQRIASRSYLRRQSVFTLELAIGVTP